MKRNSLIYIISALFGILLCGGCQDDYVENGKMQPSLTFHYLSAGWTEATVDYSRQQYPVEVYSFETPWKFSIGEDLNWLDASPMSGNETLTAELMIEENKSGVGARTALFYLESNDSDWSFSQAMSLTQYEAPAMLSVDCESFGLGAMSQRHIVKVTANCSWEATSNAESWLTVDSQNTATGELTFHVSENLQSYSRSGSIMITYGSNGGKRLSINVTQLPASTINVSEATLYFENTASKYEVEVTSEVSWGVKTADSWISVDSPSGEAGKSVVSIEVAPNTSVSERTGSVYFMIGGTTSFTLDIVQAGLYIKSDIYSLDFGASPQSQDLEITSNTGWEVLSAPEWISFDKRSGAGNDVLRVSTAENPNSFPRSGDIKIGQTGLNITCNIHVLQHGKTMSVDSDFLTFSPRGGTQTFTLTSDGEWFASHVVDWFTVTPSSGKETQVITVEASPNTENYEREGRIEFMLDQLSTFVTVHQQALFLAVVSDAYEFASVGGTNIIEISSNDAWTARVENGVDWLTLSDTSGDGDGLITMKVAENNSVNKRSTTVIIETEHAQSFRIMVSQMPRQLKLSAQSVLFFSSGGISSPVEVFSECPYSISKEGAWFSVTENKEDNTFTVKAEANPGKDLRRGTITVTALNLMEGTLSLTMDVIQTVEGFTFIKNPYQHDVDWSKLGDGKLSLSIKGYSSDYNWSDIGGGKITVGITGYTTDHDWNKGDSFNINATVTGYDDDHNWNSDVNSKGKFSVETYGNESDWNIYK